MYLVPRALAGEVEAKLRSELGSDMTVTALYGGADWGITDAWLTGDQPTVLIATVEKADALMRYLGPILAARLRLIIVDEAHQVVPEANENTRVSFSEHSNRAIRLEQLVSRVLVQRPDVVRIALTAVAGGAAGPVAKWIEAARTLLPWACVTAARGRSSACWRRRRARKAILLDIMNGRTLHPRSGATRLSAATDAGDAEPSCAHAQQPQSLQLSERPVDRASSRRGGSADPDLRGAGARADHALVQGSSAASGLGERAAVSAARRLSARPVRRSPAACRDYCGEDRSRCSCSNEALPRATDRCPSACGG
jgi:hypothetical protein